MPPTGSVNPAAELIDRYYSDPGGFSRDLLQIELDADQLSIANDIANGERRITVRSGHGVGKTTTLAVIAVWFAVTRFPQKTVCTAPTSKQLFGALAADMKAYFKRLPPEIASLFEIKTDKIELIAAPEESYISFATSRPETPEALAGVHSAHVLLITDEASGIPDAVFEAASGSMSGHNATTILTGNPVRISGLFFDTHRKVGLLETWRRYHISCEGHPRVTKDFLEDMARRYGRDSNAYRVRVLGEFPKREDDAIIPFELIELAYTRDVQPIKVKPIWGLDCARFGSDASALAKRKGNVLLEKVRVWQGINLMSLVGRVKWQWDTTPVDERPSVINVDVIGMGAGVVDRLVELGLPAQGINVSESPSLRDEYEKLRDELWFMGRDWFEKRDCSLGQGDAADKDLGDELKVPTYDFQSTGKKKAESKKQMKKRGYKSPNRADAFLLTLASEAVSASGNGRGGLSDWDKPLRRTIKGIECVV